MFCQIYQINPGQSPFPFFLQLRQVHALVVQVLGQIVRLIQDYNYDFFYIFVLQSYPSKIDLHYHFLFGVKQKNSLRKNTIVELGGSIRIAFNKIYIICLGFFVTQ
jgi:hypothetical protein